MRSSWHLTNKHIKGRRWPITVEAARISDYPIKNGLNVSFLYTCQNGTCIQSYNFKKESTAANFAAWSILAYTTFPLPYMSLPSKCLCYRKKRTCAKKD